MMEAFKVEIELGNDAMSAPEDIADALSRIADELLARGIVDGTIRDVNGNTVGGYFFET